MRFKAKFLGTFLALAISLCGFAEARPLDNSWYRGALPPLLTLKWGGSRETPSKPTLLSSGPTMPLFESGQKWGAGEWAVVGAVVVGIAIIVIIAGSHKGGGGGGGGGTTGY